MFRRVNSRIRRLKSKNKKKNDLDTSDHVDLADEPEKTRQERIINSVSKPKSGYKEIAAPVKRRKFNRDPRLGAAERIRESFREIINSWDTSPCEPVLEDLKEDYCKLEPGLDFHEEMERIEAHIKKDFPKSGEEWFARYDAQLKDLEENEEKYLAERDHTVALQAVKFYNQKHSTNYVVEETLGSYCAEFDDGLWTHCNFRAKNTGGPAGRRPVSRLFFAELFGDVDEYKVDSCVTFDGPGRCRDIVRGCEMCPKRVCHPVNGFKNGHPDEYTI